MTEITRVPLDEMPTKSRVSIVRFPGGGGLMWCVATAEDTSLDFPGQVRGALAVIDGYLRDHGLDRSRFVRVEVIVTDHDNKPAFDAIWAEWMPSAQGPVRSFVQSVMPEGDLVELIMTIALPA